ncbi:MAG: hypothetical protein R3C11_05540 [Planctomycetaceae bacterium]
MSIIAKIPPYLIYLDNIGRDVPGFLWKIVLVILLGVLFIASGLYLPAWLLKLKKNRSNQNPTADSTEESVSPATSLTSYLSLAFLGGVANCLFWWIISYHLFKSVWPGMVATAPLTCWGLYKSITNCPCKLNWDQQILACGVALRDPSGALASWNHCQ